LTLISKLQLRRGLFPKLQLRKCGSLASRGTRLRARRAPHSPRSWSFARKDAPKPEPGSEGAGEKVDRGYSPAKYAKHTKSGRALLTRFSCFSRAKNEPASTAGLQSKSNQIKPNQTMCMAILPSEAKHSLPAVRSGDNPVSCKQPPRCHHAHECFPSTVTRFRNRHAQIDGALHFFNSHHSTHP